MDIKFSHINCYKTTTYWYSLNLNPQKLNPINIKHLDAHTDLYVCVCIQTLPYDDCGPPCNLMSSRNCFSVPNVVFASMIIIGSWLFE